MDIENNYGGLQQIIDTALENMGFSLEKGFNPKAVNLSEFCRQTGFTRSKARTLQKKGFKAGPHGNTGRKADNTIIAPYADALNNLLRAGVTNSSVCMERIQENGYTGGLTTVKTYIAAHLHLVPADRRLRKPEPASRGMRYSTAPGEVYQMDWGFVDVSDWKGGVYRIACFACVCHHCGTCYVEFFPNARQENLFIGMIHAFLVLGIPNTVLTDNMKSVVIRRDSSGQPVWHTDYAAFMECIGFKTKLCKPYHPYTKGKVERLIRFVKENFLAGRTFESITDLNVSALERCARQSNRWRRNLACVPAETHSKKCLPACKSLEQSAEVAMYLCPARKISFDGFVSYEGRRFGVPYWYEGKTVRVSREGSWLHIYSADMLTELSVHAVTWGRRDSECADQWLEYSGPEELPSTQVKTAIAQLEPPRKSDGFSKFDFGRNL